MGTSTDAGTDSGYITPVFRAVCVLCAPPSQQAGAARLGRLWAVDKLAKPLVARFRFHFCTDRPTNSPERPEWFFHYALGVLRDRVGVLEDVQATVAALQVRGCSAQVCECV
jgi:hypothetical protein